jgi:hypothetical protein
MDMNKPIFIDFEASAMNGFPVQVAYGTSEADLKCFLVKPLKIWNDADYMWDFNAQDIHGFSKAFINTHGVDATEVARIVSEDLRGKTVNADSNADKFWLGLLLDDCAEVTGEMYAEPGFMLMQTRYFQDKISDVEVVYAKRFADAKLKERNLRPHQADNDVLRHIWLWEFLNEKRTYT